MSLRITVSGAPKQAKTRWQDSEVLMTIGGSLFSIDLSNSAMIYSKSDRPKKSKSAKQNEKDVEKGQLETSDGQKEDKSTRCWCCYPCKLALLVALYSILFAFWVVGLVVAIVIELFWLPFKCLCPCLCPCFCCAEKIEKEVFALVFWVLKLPFTYAKKILNWSLRH